MANLLEKKVTWLPSGWPVDFRSRSLGLKSSWVIVLCYTVPKYSELLSELLLGHCVVLYCTKIHSGHDLN